MHNIALLYPELQEFDGLPKAIQSKFSLSFPTLEIRGRSFSDLIKFMEFRENDTFYHSPTRVTSKNNNRWIDIDIALEQKLFILTMGEKENTAEAFFETDSLQKSFDMIRAWLIENFGVTQLKDSVPEANFLDLSDDIQYIRWRWARCYRQAVNVGIFTQLLAPILALAIQDPILNQLSPYTSHDTLHLSRNIEFPFSSKGLPMCHSLLSLSTYNFYKKVIKEGNIAKAEEFLHEIPPEYELVLNSTQFEYELFDTHKNLLGKGGATKILELIIEHTYGKFVVYSNGSKIGIGNTEFAKNLMSNAIPKNTGRATRQNSE